MMGEMTIKQMSDYFGVTYNDVYTAVYMKNGRRRNRSKNSLNDPEAVKPFLIRMCEERMAKTEKTLEELKAKKQRICEAGTEAKE